MIRLIWGQVRKVYPKRLYKNGMVGLKFNDDRSIAEKVCDKIDELIAVKQGKVKDNRILSNINWVDKLGNTKEKIQEHEKRGYAYASEREWDDVSKKATARIKAEQESRVRDRVAYAFSEVKKGRSYVKEQRERAERQAKGIYGN